MHSSKAARRRSGLGLLTAIVALPALLAVMGCFELPAPVGDPERSRIDPALNGVWLDTSKDSEGWMFIFEPYDKRTWLVRWVGLEERDLESDEAGDAGEDADLAGDEESALSYLDLYRAGNLQIEGMYLVKAWRKRISGRSFITFEFRGMIDEDDGMTPNTWWVAMADLVDDDKLSLQFIDQEFEGIERGMTRRQLERIVRNNLDDPDLFAGDKPMYLDRISQQDFGMLAEMLKEAGVGAAYE